jgi:GTP pyrophosphokinase
MVKVREDLPLDERGSLDVGRWTERLCERHRNLERARIERAVGIVARDYPDRYLQAGIELAELVAALNMDTASVLAALWYRLVRGGGIDRATIDEACGGDARTLLDAVLHMADTSLLEMSNSRLQTSESKDQFGNVRSMLIAMIDDGRETRRRC